MPPNQAVDEHLSALLTQTNTTMDVDKTVVVRILDRYNGEIPLEAMHHELHDARQWDSLRTSTVLGSLTSEHVLVVSSDLIVSRQ